jgi:hypothetical protein
MGLLLERQSHAVMLPNVLSSTDGSEDCRCYELCWGSWGAVLGAKTTKQARMQALTFMFVHHLPLQVSAEAPIKTEVLRTKVEITLVKVSIGVKKGVRNGVIDW